MSEPFWEASYGRPGEATFGPPAEEIVALAGRLPEGATVLDAGCGDGRHALFLARRGCLVEAIDVSRRGVEALRASAEREALPVQARVEDLGHAALPEMAYDLIVCHGVLHLLPRSVWTAVLQRFQAATRPGGWNVLAAFNDSVAPPPDLAPHVKGLLRPGELPALYDHWLVESAASYILEDEHPGGIRHTHGVEKVVARRPGVPAPDPGGAP